MARGKAIKEEGTSPASAAEQKAPSKRRCVQSACVPCRKRKSKCDGGTPVCATCTAVYKTPCFYYTTDTESRRGAHTGTKRDASAVSSSMPATANDHAEVLVAAIRNLPEADVNDLIQRIRKDATLDIPALAEDCRKIVTLPPTATHEPQSLEGELSMLLGKPAMTQSGVSRFYGHTSNMSLVQEDENYTRPRPMPQAASAERNPYTWTSVTDDLAFVERLLDLYFRWSHPFYVVFSRECFYKDFRSGRGKYCSSLLVNAILAYGCHFSDEPAGRTDPDDPRTAGDHFFEEARRLLYEDETSCLTTVQALGIMCMREPSAGRDSSGFSYMGRCMRMAIEMGLHLKNSAAISMGLTPSEIEVRKVTFWGCFTVDTVWSICIGRLSQLPRIAITLDKPILDESPSSSSTSRLPPGTVTSRMFLQEFSSLSELINDNNYMFYAPNFRLTDIRLMNCYNKYLEWFKNLPPQLKLDGATGDLQPHIITLHMLYHTAISHLFRPMLKIDLINFKLKPRNACIESANHVSELLRLYRQYYSLRTCNLVLTHILLATCIVHLTFKKDPAYALSSHRYLVEGLQALEDLSPCHWFGARAFRIIYETSKAWDLGWVEELKDSKLVPQPGAEVEQTLGPPAPPLGSGKSNTPHSAEHKSMPASTLPARRESLGIFSDAKEYHTHPPQSSVPQPNTSRPLPTTTQTLHRTASLSHAPNIVPYSPTSAPEQHPHHHQQQQQQQQQQDMAGPTSTAPTDSAETLFWNPLPNMAGMGLPILPRNNYNVGPMDLDRMLGSDEWDRFSRDGFKMSETWSPEVAGAYGGGSDEYTGPPQPPPQQHAQGQVSIAAERFNGVGFAQSQMGGHQHAHPHTHPQQGYGGGWWGGEGRFEQ